MLLTTNQNTHCLGTCSQEVRHAEVALDVEQLSEQRRIEATQVTLGPRVTGVPQN